MIHHLSYPEGGSINHYIPQEFCTVQYQSVHTAIEIIKQLGKGALLAKTDIENAYKQIPIHVHPDDFELLGFMAHVQYYYDKTLPFGLSVHAIYLKNLVPLFSGFYTPSFQFLIVSMYQTIFFSWDHHNHRNATVHSWLFMC